MKHERTYRLLQAIGEIRDETVRDALPPPGRSFRGLAKWASLAAALLICTGVMSAVMMGDDGFFPGSDTGTPTHAVTPDDSDTTASPETEETTEETADTADPPATGVQTPGAAFTPVTGAMSPIVYSGPILPLTAEGNTDGLRVVRQLTLYTDEVNYRVTASFPDFLVTDCYILENHGDTAKTLTMLYPVITACTSDAAAWPVIELRGGGRMETVIPAVYAGVYSGTYVGGGAGDTHTLNQQALSTAQEYEALLADGSYRQDALSRTDMGERQVLDYKRYGLTPPEKADAAQYQRQTLSRLIQNAAAQYRQQREKYYDFVPDTFLLEALPENLLRSIVYEELARLGPLGDTPVDRWTVGGSVRTMEDVIEEIFAQERVFYLAFPITIPAHGSEVVFIRQERTAAYDYRDLSLFRIDAAPALDTVLPFVRRDFIVLPGEKFETVRTSEEPEQTVGGLSIRMQDTCVWVDLEKK